MEPSQSNQLQTGSSSSSSEFRLRPETTVTAHYLAVVCRDLAHRRLHKGFFQWLRHDDLVNRELAQSIYAQAQTTAMDPQSDSVTGAGTRIRTFVDAAVQKDDESTHASTEERSGAQSAGQSETLQTDSSASDNNSSDPQRSTASRASRNSSSASWFSSVEVYSENSEESWTNGSTRSTCTPSYTGSVRSSRTTSSMSSTTAEGVRLPRAPRVQGNMSEVVRRQHNFQANMSEVGRRQHNFQASPLRSMQPQICCR